MSIGSSMSHLHDVPILLGPFECFKNLMIFFLSFNSCMITYIHDIQYIINKILDLKILLSKIIIIIYYDFLNLSI